MDIDTRRPEPRSRRAILAGAIGGLAGAIATRFASPDRATAAAGDPLIIGNTSNNAGTSNTTLTTASTGTGLLVTQNGAGTALRGSAVGPGSIAGFFTANNGTGISGVTGNPGSYGVFAQNNGAAGAAGALRAAGGNNHGIVATTSNSTKNAIMASANVAGASAILGTATQTGVEGVGFRGVYGHTNDTGAIGVLGYGGTGDGNVGVQGDGGTGDGNVGVQGVVNNATGIGVYGVNHANSNSSIGVRGHTDATSSAAAGVLGTDGGGAEASRGVVGVTNSTNGMGVRGQANQDSVGAAGVSGVGTGMARGVIGESNTGTGVFGASNTGVGVYGASTIYGLYGSGVTYLNGDVGVDGDVNVTGSVNKAGGTFRIDHPLDPAGKFLSHSFVESPDMMNVYNGLTTLDAAGEATVALPGYFEALNRDVRYQLTALGKPAPDLYVKAKVKGNAFSIGGGKAGQEVSWQVTGIRQDAWANAHRVVVETPKPNDQKGKYLHPREHGEPDSKAIGYAKHRAIEAAHARR